MTPDGNTRNEAASAGRAAQKKGVLRRFVLPAFIFLLVIGLSAGLFFLNKTHPEVIKRFETLGYAGIFVVSLLSSATVIVPIPGIVVFVPLLAQFNPVLVGVVGAAGGTIGEITGYMAGYSGSGLAGRGKMYARVEVWMKRHGNWVVFLVALLFFVDVAGIVAGALKFPLRRFLVLVWAGKTIKYVVVMLLVAWGWDFVLKLIG